MWSCNRRALLAALPGFALAGCGFSPAYGPGGAATRLQNTVLADAPVGRPAYLLTRHIEDRLGRGSPARYGLSYAINLDEEAIAISANNVTTRYNILGNVKYALRDLQSTEVLLTGSADSFVGYSASGSTVATQAARRDAEARLMTILAEQILNRLTAEAGALPA
ncbi:LPS assembly lipoprotein LptE [Roseovarius aestuariivivens]|uniref:LPS assembly lipoprotein LptE n=1 Tax=Roseovarius aestuariivivens TaxID=1888910 RepID=UPI0010812D69|nr:LPS assembly lipoprotein LptE [Roseovarius aestuariivivens]